MEHEVLAAGASPLPLIELEGSAFERGHLQGRAQRGRVPRMVDALLEVPALPGFLAPRAQRLAVKSATTLLGATYLTVHRRLLQEHQQGRYWEVLRGLASGLGLAPHAVYGFNAFELESANPSFRLGCTALALAGETTQEGVPLLGYNHDFPPSFAPFLLVRRTRGPDVLQNLSVSYPVLVGAVAGVNEAGLAVSLNQAFATDLRRTRAGLLSTLLVQTCLDTCASVVEAVEFLRSARSAVGALITLVDATSDRAVVEVSSTRVAVRREPRDRLLHAFNKYHAVELEAVEVPLGAVTVGFGAGYDIHEPNVQREARLPRIADGQQSYERWQLWSLLADHGESGAGMNTICCHGDAMNWTILSAVIDPSARSVEVSRGPACQRQPRTYRL
ncbi:MAG: C45 family peptidase [Polyangiaceae bacterium]